MKILGFFTLFFLTFSLFLTTSHAKGTLAITSQDYRNCKKAFRRYDRAAFLVSQGDTGFAFFNPSLSSGCNLALRELNDPRRRECAILYVIIKCGY